MRIAVQIAVEQPNAPSSERGWIHDQDSGVRRKLARQRVNRLFANLFAYAENHGEISGVIFIDCANGRPGQYIVELVETNKLPAFIPSGSSILVAGQHRRPGRENLCVV